MMTRIQKIGLHSTILMLVVFLLFFCQSDTRIDLPQIEERGKLIAITTYSSTSYFIYRGRPMGFEYELLQRLSEHLNLELDIVIAKNLDNLTEMLISKKGDIIAHGLTVTRDRQERMAFTDPHIVTHQVLVQRKPENWRDMKLHEIEEELIRDPNELAGKSVHVREKSSYYQRLENLSREIIGGIDIQIAPGDLETEDLIKMVAEGEIDYTVADENIAMINATYFSNIDVQTDISLPQYIAWAVRKDSRELLEAVNGWLEDIKRTPDYNVIYRRYFENRKAYNRRIESDFFSRTGGQISRYDDLIKAGADTLGWDWRLLASMVYQESKFNPRAKSWAGARGLMQMMPATARQYGVGNVNVPSDNLQGATAYLIYLQDFWGDIPDSLQRMKFVMASFNAGENHIADARRLTEKYGGDPEMWDGNVEEYILLKSKPKFYNDDVVDFGYCRGEEPYNYVRDIFERYEHYKKFIPLAEAET